MLMDKRKARARRIPEIEILQTAANWGAQWRFAPQNQHRSCSLQPLDIYRGPPYREGSPFETTLRNTREWLKMWDLG